MVQLNLLPDVKLEYIKAQRRKRLVLSLASLVSIGSVSILVILFLFVGVAQKQHLKALDKDINGLVETLKSTPDLDKILTVQNQLSVLPTLHNDKTISSRTFDYLSQLTPNSATIAEVNLDFDTDTLNIKGNADSLRTINKFADSLKFTTYKVSGPSPAEGKAFSEVVLKSFSVEDNVSGSSQVVYELEMKFDKAIYANSAPNTEGKSPVELIVPEIISTRSATQTPNRLFAPQTESEAP